RRLRASSRPSNFASSARSFAAFSGVKPSSGFSCARAPVPQRTIRTRKTRTKRWRIHSPTVAQQQHGGVRHRGVHFLRRGPAIRQCFRLLENEFDGAFLLIRRIFPSLKRTADEDAEPRPDALPDLPIDGRARTQLLRDLDGDLLEGV